MKSLSTTRDILNTEERALFPEHAVYQPAIGDPAAGVEISPLDIRMPSPQRTPRPPGYLRISQPEDASGLDMKLHPSTSNPSKPSSHSVPPSQELTLALPGAPSSPLLPYQQLVRSGVLDLSNIILPPPSSFT